MALQMIIAAVLTLLGFLVMLGLVRIATTLAIFIIALGSGAVVLYNIYNHIWLSWPDIVAYSLITGAAGALLCVPLLPLSSFYRRR